MPLKGIKHAQVQTAETGVVSSALGRRDVVNLFPKGSCDVFRDLWEGIRGSRLLYQKRGFARREADNLGDHLEEKNVVIGHDAVLDPERMSEIDCQQNPKQEWEGSTVLNEGFSGHAATLGDEVEQFVLGDWA